MYAREVTWLVFAHGTGWHGGFPLSLDFLVELSPA